MNLDALPGGDLIAEGLRDLAAGRDTVPALLVLIGAPRLSALGLPIPRTSLGAEHRLDERLAADDAATAHSRYNVDSAAGESHADAQLDDIGGVLEYVEGPRHR